MATVEAGPGAGAARAPDPEPAPRPARPPRGEREQALTTVAVLAASAGVIHAVAMVDHFDHYWLYGAFFLVVTYAQILGALWIYRHAEHRRALVAAAAVSLAVVAVWLWTRAVGPPVGPEAGEPEPVGAMDLMATFDQLALAALVVALVAPETRLGRRLGWLASSHAVRLAIMLCSASLLSLLIGSHEH